MMENLFSLESIYQRLIYDYWQLSNFLLDIRKRKEGLRSILFWIF